MRFLNQKFMNKKVLFALVLLPFLFGSCMFSPDQDVPIVTDEEQEQVEPVKVDVATDVSYNVPVQLDKLSVMGGYKNKVLEAYKSALGDYAKDYKWEDIAYLFEWYEVGEIKVDSYAGWKLLILDLQCDGMCMKNDLYRFAWDPKTSDLVHLAKHSEDEYIPDHVVPLTAMQDKLFELPSLKLPEKILMPDGEHYLTMSEEDMEFNFKDYGKVVFVSPEVGNVYEMYTDSNVGCLYVEGKDSSVTRYEYNPGFFEGKGDTVSFSDGGQQVSMAEKYSYVASGCGITGNCYFVEEPDESNLSNVAESSSGVKFYAVKDIVENAAETPEKFSSERVLLSQTYVTYKSMYEYMSEEEKGEFLSFDEFLAINPILYWKDPLGRWSPLIAIKVKPLAECGKPVIYLYPEKETDVSVKVFVDEFTKTVPEYNDGWLVHAYPNGRLYNYADGLDYPYLFWEGHKKGGISADRGFVVPRDDLRGFLKDSLSKMGLSRSETSDFMDFWLSKMLDNSERYFFISFLGTSDFNRVAPLAIDPKPDTLLRVFMYYHPTNTFLNVRAQKLEAPARRGFTVVEWGGTSSRAWKN